LNTQAIYVGSFCNSITCIALPDLQHHRTRFNNFFLVQRWAPEAALQQKAQERLRALAPQRGDTVYLILEDSKHAKRGQHMDAIAKMKDPTTAGSAIQVMLLQKLPT
jgi:hypothetical protein